MPDEKSPAQRGEAGTGKDEYHAPNSTTPRRRIKRPQLRLSDDGRRALNLLYGQLNRRIEEGNEHAAAVNARHIARIYGNHKEPDEANERLPSVTSVNRDHEDGDPER